MSSNLRAKIYALFMRLGFVDLPGIETEDHVTLSLIEKYLDWKRAEVWSEVIAELESGVPSGTVGTVGGVQSVGRAGVRPVSPDREAMQLIEHACIENAESTRKVQKELMEAQKEQDRQHEQRYYAEVLCLTAYCILSVPVPPFL